MYYFDWFFSHFKYKDCKLFFYTKGFLWNNYSPYGNSKYRQDKRGGNLLAKYSTEKEGQIAFFKTYQPYISQIKDKTLEDIFLQYTDGLIGGNILEFKLNISDINKVLFQTIKYLSKCRINGIPVPANILLISLNNSIVYKFDSAQFLSQIETMYIGAINTTKTLIYQL